MATKQAPAKGSTRKAEMADPPAKATTPTARNGAKAAGGKAPTALNAQSAGKPAPKADAKPRRKSGT